MTRSTTELLQRNAHHGLSWWLEVFTLSCKRNLDAFSELLYNLCMSEKKEQKVPSKDQARDDRLKAALKSNMAKRKVQAKARNKNEK